LTASAQYVPGTRPLRFPSAFRWIGAAREDVFNLYPEQCFSQLRIDKTLFQRQIVYLSDIDAAKLVLGRASSKFRLSNLQKRLLSPALGKGIIVAEGDSWACQRRISLRVLERFPEHLSEHFDYLDTRLDEVASKLVSCTRGAQSDSTGVFAELQTVALDILYTVLFGGAGRIATSQTIAAISDYLQCIQRFDAGDITGFVAGIASPKMKRARRIACGHDRTIHQMIDEVQDPLLDQACWTQDEKRDFVVSFLSGFETTALGVLWGLGHLALSETHQLSMAEAEVAWVPRRRSAWPDHGFSERFAAEVLRLYPPLPFMCRVARETVDTPAGEIRRGSLVMISPYVIHRHRAFWDRPDEFDPARYDGGPNEAFIPFGTGARRCVGMSLGWFLVQYLLRELSRRLHVSLDGPLPQPRGGLSLRPKESPRLRFELRPQVIAAPEIRV